MVAFWRTLCKGSFISVYFGHTRVTAEAATQSTTRVWHLDHYPVSGKNIRVRGTIGADENVVVNYELEPLTGRITMDNALPEFDSVEVDYFYYVNIEDGVDILTRDFKVEFPRPTAEITIFGQPHYTIHNNYPHKLSFKIVLEREGLRNLLTESMFHADYFLVVDKNIGRDVGIRAYEGPLWSDETGSIYKGFSHLVPIELFVQNYGLFTEGWSGDITAFSNMTTYVKCTSAGHGLSNGQWIVISGTGGLYDGRWKVQNVVAGVSFGINTFYTFPATGEFTLPDQIEWSFWENT